MRIALFLHLYQPPTQFPEVLAKIIKESYEPLVSLLEKNPKAKMTLNLSASLLDWFHRQDPRLLSRIKKIAEVGAVEFTGSAAFHPLLTKLPEEEVERQIALNEISLNKHLGIVGPVLRSNSGGENQNSKPVSSFEIRASDLAVRGFFPPEMSINSQVCQKIKKMGYQYVLVDESAIPAVSRGRLRQTRFFHDRDSGLALVVRSRKLSLDVAFSQIRRLSDLRLTLSQIQIRDLTDKDPGSCVVLALDGETFGHHQPQQMSLLEDLLIRSSREIELVTVSDLLGGQESLPEVEVQESSWGESFDRWNNPKNPVQEKQWQLTNLSIRSVENSKFKPQTSNQTQNSKRILNNLNFNVDLSLEFCDLDLDFVDSLSTKEREWVKARRLLDQALHSDQYWWSAHNPCWHYQMVERGAKLLLDSVEALPEEEARDEKLEARSLYQKLLDTAANLYGTGVIAC